MKLFLKLAWRNLLRNKRRTFIASLAIAIGLSALIIYDALIIGMKDTTIETITSEYFGDAQIQNEEYKLTSEIDKTIANADEILNNLSTEEIVQAYTPRLSAFGMITSPTEVQGVSIVGVKPDTEKDISRIDERIIEGDFFQSGESRNILIGRDLADLLEVKLGSKVVLTVAQAESGELSQEMFRISGIYAFADKAMNKSMVFIELSKAQELFGLQGKIHKIAIKFTNHDYAMDSNNPFWARYSNNGNLAEGWSKLFPQLDAMLKSTDMARGVVFFVLFGIIVFGIVNTMFMSIYERMFEFGVLKAVGTRKFKIFQLVIFESACLALVSIVLGIIIGFIATGLFARVGIDYSDVDFSGVTFSDRLRPVMNIWQFIIYPIIVFLFTVIVGIYPAIHASRLKPTEAMRRSL